ncbi:MAG: sterol desaturase family protein [Cyclobacteriaceae bacterium]|nr:sterol desaturase family protein [Cyclobacteriaceae bacterium]MDX5468061.1 sterol desaturase family protein [Cyclobacteriaceae bacterium]
MKTYLHAPEKELGKCFFQASLILISVIFFGLICENPIASFLILLAGGWLTWTFVEYAIHRFLMHELIIPGKKADILNHQRHHQHPHDLKVKPIHRVGVLLLAMVLLGIALKVQNAFTILAGFFIGFLIYNYLHYILHHPAGKYILPKIQKAHILHHTRYPTCGYSFSTILWDWLFDTLPPGNAVVTEKMRENFFGNSFLKKKPSSKEQNVSLELKNKN